MKTKLSMTLAVLGLFASGYANAVPCGVYGTYGGVSQAIDCRNSPVNDATDSAADLNSGNYFGHNDWLQLTRTGQNDPNAGSFWTVTLNGSGKTGTFTLASNIWKTFSDLAVVLKDGGSWHDSRFKWSAYLLPEGQLGTYNWSFDGGHKAMAHMTLYGRLAPVPEPASLALVLTGLAGVALMRRRAPQKA